jgi:antitoxin VapB
MGVQLNIKDEQTVELARKLAKQLGKSVTEVVREALEEKQRRRAEEIEDAVRKVMRLTEGLRDHWNPDTRHLSSQELMDSLYDEHGLPI